jgi:hypothetical protein
VIDRATAVAQALACSDTAALDRLCHDDVFIWGTDEDEVWHGKAALLDAFLGAYHLKVRWVGEPIAGSHWVAGVVEFESEHEETVRARVSMVFTEGLLAHAHYSVAR